MQNLINELLNPKLNKAGELLAPEAVKRRAALAIKQLYEQGQQDLNARKRLEQQQGFEPLTLEHAKEIFNTVINQEYYDANS